MSQRATTPNHASGVKASPVSAIIFVEPLPILKRRLVADVVPSPPYWTSIKLLVDVPRNRWIVMPDVLVTLPTDLRENPIEPTDVEAEPGRMLAGENCAPPEKLAGRRRPFVPTRTAAASIDPELIREAVVSPAL
jgi:hypothetical protein